MSNHKATKTRPATQGKELAAPFNLSHPSSKCDQHVHPRTGAKMRHKFKTTERKLVRPGVFATVMTCQHCAGFVRGLEDYTVTAAVFAA